MKMNLSFVKFKYRTQGLSRDNKPEDLMEENTPSDLNDDWQELMSSG